MREVCLLAYFWFSAFGFFDNVSWQGVKYDRVYCSSVTLSATPIPTRYLYLDMRTLPDQPTGTYILFIHPAAKLDQEEQKSIGSG